MAQRVMALDNNNQMSWCTATPENRGKGNCPHKIHQEPGESVQDFMTRAEEYSKLDDNTIQELKEVEKNKDNDYRREEDEEIIKEYLDELDEIAGEKVTNENLDEVLNRLTPEQMNRFAQIGFSAAPTFSLPVSDEHYGEADVENKLYFATLPQNKVGGKMKAIEQMFCKVGTVPTHKDEEYDIEHSYYEGLTPQEYFAKQFTARKANVSKSIDVAKPGYSIWAKQKIRIIA